jgi:2TM domain
MSGQGGGGMLVVARKEVIIVPTETLTKNERTVSQPTPTVRDEEVRAWARQHVEHVRKLRRNVATFALGMAALTAIWALVEWQDNGGFERLSNNGNPGDWEPWILFVGLVWGFFICLDALKTYFDRPTTDAEIDREIRRLTTRR